MFGLKLTNMCNFHQLQVVGRGGVIQFQVGEKFSGITPQSLSVCTITVKTVKRSCIDKIGFVNWVFSRRTKNNTMWAMAKIVWIMGHGQNSPNHGPWLRLSESWAMAKIFQSYGPWLGLSELWAMARIVRVMAMGHGLSESIISL